MSPILHYIYDPLCGWCYAAAPLIDAVADLPGLQLELHGGGMLSDGVRWRVTPGLREQLLVHDRRIERLTGQAFGDGYVNGLLRDDKAVFDSMPPTTAILAAQSLAKHPAQAIAWGLRMLARIQRAHYVEGRRISEWATLFDLAAELGLDEGQFEAAWAQWEGPAAEAHVSKSKAWRRLAGVQGFPSVVLEDLDGGLHPMQIGRYYGQVDAWRVLVRLTVDRARRPFERTQPSSGLIRL